MEKVYLPEMMAKQKENPEIVFQSVTIDVLEEYLFVDRDPTDTVKAQFCCIAETISQRSTHGGDVEFDIKVKAAVEKWENTKNLPGKPNGTDPLSWLQTEYLKDLEELTDAPLMTIFNLINVYVEAAQQISRASRVNSKGPFWRLSNKFSWIIVDPTSAYITEHYRTTIFAEIDWKTVLIRDWILDLKPSGKLTPPNSPSGK